MTRRNLRSNAVPTQLQNGTAFEKEDGPISLGSIEGNESSSKIKINGGSSAAKKVHRDVKEVPLKDRLKVLRGKENDSGIEALAESTVEGSMADNASTSTKDLSKKADAGDAAGGKGESLAVLLDQGLTSGDVQKIDAVLSRTEVQTISATLNDLPIVQIVPLLKQIEYRLRNRSNLECWIRWIQYIISMHMSYLSTLGTLEDDLKGLFDWMRSRTAHMGKLLELYGKLALVTEQVERRANPRLFILQEPKIFFTGEDVSSAEDSDELDELDDESIASNDDWWDDDEIASDGDQEPTSGSEDEGAGKVRGDDSSEGDGSEDLEEGESENDESSGEMEVD